MADTHLAARHRKHWHDIVNNADGSVSGRQRIRRLRQAGKHEQRKEAGSKR
jgi:hypothetical protein